MLEVINSNHFGVKGLAASNDPPPPSGVKLRSCGDYVITNILCEATSRVYIFGNFKGSEFLVTQTWFSRPEVEGLESVMK